MGVIDVTLIQDKIITYAQKMLNHQIRRKDRIRTRSDILGEMYITDIKDRMICLEAINLIRYEAGLELYQIVPEQVRIVANILAGKILQKAHAKRQCFREKSISLI